jgi:NitT/TauT family transport system ATP-binding protein
MPKAERAKHARDRLALVGLNGLEDRYPHEPSGSMKQRISIARGLVQDPPILMLDKPFAALDEQTRISRGQELLRMWERTGKTIIFVTHSLTETAYLADEIIGMLARPGRVIDRIEVDLPRPRTYEMMSTPRLAELRERIWV